jgi:hypothetical protein
MKVTETKIEGIEIKKRPLSTIEQATARRIWREHKVMRKRGPKHVMTLAAYKQIQEYLKS